MITTSREGRRICGGRVFTLSGDCVIEHDKFTRPDGDGMIEPLNGEMRPDGHLEFRFNVEEFPRCPYCDSECAVEARYKLVKTV